MLIPFMGFTQSGLNWKKFIVADTLTADSGYVLTTSGIYSSWNVTIVCGTTTSTTSTVKIQVSPNGTDWIDYANLSTTTIATDKVISFEDSYCPLRWMRVYFDIESATSVPIKGWYVFKNLN